MSGEANPTPETSFPKGRIHVLLLESIHASAHQLIETEGFRLELVSGALGEEELCEKIKGIHVIGIRSKTHITAKVLENADRLLAIGCFCIGTNQVDLAAANRHGVPVFNAPFSNTRSVAELVIAEVVALARRLGDRNTQMHQGAWKKTAEGSNEVRGKTLGIIGYGHIGTQVGILAEAFGLRVLFHDIVDKLPLGNARQCSDLRELLAESDFVTLHVPATEQTENMIDAAVIAQMKPGARLINLSRGNVVDIPALAQALREERLAGAAVDVFPKEPRNNSEPFESELRGLPNVVLTPHVGGSTEEAQEAIGREVASALVKLINTGSTLKAVNFPEIEPPPQGQHRILNVHKNVPGVLTAVNRIISDCNANVVGQQLATDANIGYLVIDLDRGVSDDVKEALSALDTSIRTRILY